MVNFLWICLGGAIGTGARYFLSGWALRLFGTGFPFGTLAVNVVGSFLIGVIMYLGLTASVISPTVRIVLTTGVMGGFTTYSSFNYETVQYFQGGIWLMGVLNIFVMVFSCLVAGFLGLWGARWLFGN